MRGPTNFKNPFKSTAATAQAKKDLPRVAGRASKFRAPGDRGKRRTSVQNENAN